MPQRRPRQFDSKHLDFIRSLPCIICADNTSTEAAHIRYGDLSVAKPQTGIATKSHDKYTLPLCGKCHRSQHSVGDERKWWRDWEIDPVKKALALYTVSGDYETGCAIVRGNNN